MLVVHKSLRFHACMLVAHHHPNKHRATKHGHSRAAKRCLVVGVQKIFTNNARRLTDLDSHRRALPGASIHLHEWNWAGACWWVGGGWRGGERSYATNRCESNLLMHCLYLA